MKIREILFRGKRVDNGEWVYWNVFGWIVEDINNYKSGHRYDGNISDIYEIQIETIGRYTGLQDKNGVKIFEGDIVDDSFANQLTNEMEVQRYIVKYIGGQWKLIYIDNTRKPYLDRWLWMQNERFKVIGNIHENPELINSQ